MYKVYIKSETSFDGRKLIGEFRELEDANEKLESELAKDENLKYVMEETTGHVDIYGDLTVNIIRKN